MDSKVISLHHRSKERIKDFGEVFTPESYVNKMLDLLDDKTNKTSIWSDENIIFFEPTCGHGNFVEAIFKRRFDGFFKKALKEKVQSPHLFSVANTMNTLWAIDLDKANVEFCRSRILILAVKLLSEQEKSKSIEALVKKHIIFLAHLICAIRWQINENEAISALGDDLNAQSNAEKTKMGSDWLRANKHKPLDFEFTWCDYYDESQQTKAPPLEFTRALRFLESGISQKNSQYKDFEFAKIIFSNEQLNHKELLAG